MTESPDRTETVFAGAVALPTGERAAFLDQACAGDAAMRGHVEALLRAHERAGHLLDRPVPGGPEQTGAYIPGEQPGAVIAGRYKLLEAIGEGGMGTVWVAEQTQPVRRKVALKLIKAGMDSRNVIARFEAERQALAVMDHPNVAKVLDGGLTEAGRPFFVMEYVKGVPITEYCDATRLSVPERLQLFAQVCQAVQHAHQKGIIHRDLKPSNILVAPYDDKPVPKIIDFGLAKAMNQSLTEKTLHTAHESVLGTPLYMSPEQAQLNNLDVDTRSDIYSLGVLLYELLTGTTPVEKKRFKEAAWDEVKRIIREEEPPRPSARLSSADTLPSLAACRHTEPLQLTKLVRGELDWIVMKALEKDRTRRYETANGFAADVQRYLSGEAVQAHPPGTAYRLRKFVGRNKGQVIAASLVLAALVVGVIGTTLGLFEAKRQEGLARFEAAAKELALVAEKQQREKAEEKEREAVAAREREAAQRVKAEKAYARTTDVLDTMVSEVTGDSLATQKAITAEQKKFLAEVLTYYREFAGEKADDEKTRRRTARAAFRLGLIEDRLGGKEESAAAFSRACDGYAALAAEFPAVPAYRQDLANSHHNLGLLLAGLGQRPAAEQQFKKALAIREKLAAEFPAVPDYRQDLAGSHNGLGNLLAGLGQRPAAEEQYRQALAIREKLAAEFPAVPAYRVQLGGSYCNFGTLVRDGGRPADGLAWFQQAIDALRAVHEKEPRDVAARQFLRNSYWSRAKAYDRLEKYADAAKDWDKAVELSEQQEQPRVRAARAISKLQAGQVTEAVPEVAELSKSSGWNAGQWYDFARVYAVAGGKLADKKDEYARRAVELLQRAVNAGYKDAAHMKKDTDLDPLRDREDFKKLLAELEKKAEPKK